MYLIEDPSMFASISEWRTHLRMLDGLPQDDWSIQAAMWFAHLWMARLEGKIEAPEGRT